MQQEKKKNYPIKRALEIEQKHFYRIDKNSFYGWTTDNDINSKVYTNQKLPQNSHMPTIDLSGKLINRYSTLNLDPLQNLSNVQFNIENLNSILNDFTVEYVISRDKKAITVNELKELIKKIEARNPNNIEFDFKGFDHDISLNDSGLSSSKILNLGQLKELIQKIEFEYKLNFKFFILNLHDIKKEFESKKKRSNI